MISRFLFAVLMSLNVVAHADMSDSMLSVLTFTSSEGASEVLQSLLRIYNLGIMLVVLAVGVGTMMYAGALAVSEGKGIGRKVNTWVLIRTIAGFIALVPLGPNQMSGIQYFVGGIIEGSVVLVESLGISYAAGKLTPAPRINYADFRDITENPYTGYQSLLNSALCNEYRMLNYAGTDEPIFVVRIDEADPKGFFYSYRFEDAESGETSYADNTCGVVTFSSSVRALPLLYSIREVVHAWVQQTGKSIFSLAAQGGDIKNAIGLKFCSGQQTAGCKNAAELWGVSSFGSLLSSFIEIWGMSERQPLTEVDGETRGWIESLLLDHGATNSAALQRVLFEQGVSMPDWVQTFKSKVVVNNVTPVPTPLRKYNGETQKDADKHAVEKHFKLINDSQKGFVPKLKAFILAVSPDSDVKHSPESKHVFDRLEKLGRENLLPTERGTLLDPTNSFAGMPLDVNILPTAINAMVKKVINKFIELLRSENPMYVIGRIGNDILQIVAEFWRQSTWGLAAEADKITRITYTASSATSAALWAGYGIAAFGFKPGGVYHSIMWYSLVAIDSIIELFNILADIDESFLYQWEPLGNALSVLFFIWGAFFGALLPLVPSLILTFALIGWLLLIVEVMIASPLVALGLAHPSGQQFLGASEQSLMLFLLLFLRPALIFVAVIISSLLAYCAIKMLNACMAVLLGTLMAPDLQSLNMWIDGIIIVLAMLVYGYLAFLVMVQSYTIIGILPDKISGWIGSGPLGGDNPLQQFAGIRQGVEGAAQKLGQGTASSKTKQERSEAKSAGTKAIKKMAKGSKQAQILKGKAMLSKLMGGGAQMPVSKAEAANMVGLNDVTLTPDQYKSLQKCFANTKLQVDDYVRTDAGDNSLHMSYKPISSNDLISDMPKGGTWLTQRMHKNIFNKAWANALTD